LVIFVVGKYKVIKLIMFCVYGVTAFKVTSEFEA